MLYLMVQSSNSGPKIVLISRVLCSAFSLFPILFFFVAGTGSLFILINGADVNLFSWARIFPKTMAMIAGEFSIDHWIEVGNKVFGESEAQFVYTIFLIFVIFCGHIVLMNVFTALAVGDVTAVMGKAENTMARKQMISVSIFNSKNKCIQRAAGIDPSNKLTIKIVHSFTWLTFLKNRIRMRHYPFSDGHMMVKSKLSRWLNDRPKFSGSKSTDETSPIERIQALDDKFETFKENIDFVKEILIKKKSSKKKALSFAGESRSFK